MTGWLAVAAVAWAGAPVAMPCSNGAPLFAGRATINLTPAEYEVCAGGGTGDRLDLAARRAGWRPAPAGAVVLPIAGGAVVLRAYVAGAACLLQGVTDGAAPVTVRARLEQAPVWAGPAGEAPGREPAGAPRPAAGRRLLHVAGRGFEAACYRSSAPVREVLRDAARRLAWRGWNAAPLGKSGLLAARAGSPDLAWHARADDGGSLVLVMASERTE